MVVLVTGCRSGFGLLTAVEAARRGHVVYAGLRDLSTAGDLIRASKGSNVTPLALDVTDPIQRRAAVDRILDDHGRIDALVNNAGIALGGFLEQVEADELRQVLETNVVAPWALTREVLPAMRVRRTGTVVMVSSMSGRMGFPGVGAYAASKFALEGMSEAWHHELALFGIRLVLVEPAHFRTDLLERNRRLARHAGDEDSPWAPWARHLDVALRKRVERSAGDPHDVARLVADVIESKSPRFRNPIGPGALARELLGRITPFRLTEKVIARFLRLPQ
jgi:NAD(P)-dependent dehydrogenase (short-subunit alcohol dehydrogenase family)